LRPLSESIYGGKPGQPVELKVERDGEPSPLTLRFVTASPVSRAARSLAQRVADQVLATYPVLFLVVSLPVLLLRVQDRNAWFLALVFASFIAAAPDFETSTPPSVWPFFISGSGRRR
jgi:hypothetical protein